MEPEERNRQMQTLLSGLDALVVGLFDKLELDEMLKGLIARACDLFRTQNAVICWVDEASGTLTPAIGMGRYADFQLKGYTFILGRGVVGRVAQTGQPLVVEDYQNWPGRLPEEVWTTLHTSAGIPLKANGKVAGVIVIEFFEQPRAFPADELLLLNRFGTLASIAMENARMYSVLNQELRERRRVEEELRASEEALLETQQHLEQQVEQRSEQLLLAKEAAEAANRAKSLFLANMSHELRTPLNAILGFTHILRSSPTALGEDRSYLEKIHRAGEHLLVLINDVLSIAKIESGKLTLVSTRFNLRTVLQGILELVSTRADEKGLDLEMHIAEQVPVSVAADEGKLRQVLVNLLSNAIKFTAKGKVSLAVSQVLDQTRFEVRDTGPGMTLEEQGHLFTAFTQTDSGQKAKEGTGLGLHISQAMVHLMGGAITVLSEVGHGSCFQFELRLEEVQGVDAAAPAGPPVLGLADGQTPLRMLVVDDRSDNREVLRGILELWGIEVREAADGVEALGVWNAWRPRLVWMDLRMPNLDGWEACQAIRRREAELNRPRTLIFAISASVLEVDRSQVLAEGFDEFIPKPFREEQLVQVLEDHAGLVFRRQEAREARQALDAVWLRGLPGPWKAGFQRALRIGDSDEALRLLGRLGEDPRIRALEAMVRNYHIDELLGKF
jgi:two-component system sensor histidine kinase/response regulator